MSDIAKCPSCSKYFDNSFAAAVCPKCGAKIDGAQIPNETFSTSVSQVSKEEISKIDTYLPLNIFALVLCLPLAIVGLIFSVLTMRDKRSLDYANAISHSALAKKFMIGSYIVGGIYIFIMLVNKFGGR